MSNKSLGKLAVVLIAFLIVSLWPLTSLAQQLSADPDPASTDHASAVDQPAASSLPRRHIKPKEEYVIGAADVLAINVWHETEISRVTPVRPDGKIALPLVGEVQASGLTPDQLQANLREGLQKYLDHPEVTVMVQEVKSHQINVVGQVAKPGSYILGKPLTVLDAIALAGGFQEFASQKKIYVLRARSDGSEQRIPFNYKAVIKGHDPLQNIILQPNDTVVVP